jgi:hypothetical protein
MFKLEASRVEGYVTSSCTKFCLVSISQKKKLKKFEKMIKKLLKILRNITATGQISWQLVAGINDGDISGLGGTNYQQNQY